MKTVIKVFQDTRSGRFVAATLHDGKLHSVVDHRDRLAAAHMAKRYAALQGDASSARDACKLIEFLPPRDGSQKL